MNSDEDISKVRHWHLSPVKVYRDEDGYIVEQWCQTESPNLALEWDAWEDYLPTRVDWN
jgi:hypothetical protein